MTFPFSSYFVDIKGAENLLCFSQEKTVKKPQKNLKKEIKDNKIVDMKIDGSYLNCLRAQVRTAYTRATNKTLVLSGTRGNEDYENLRQAMIKKLDLKQGKTRMPPSDDVFINFFSNKAEIKIQPASIRLFEDFINAFDLDCGEKSNSNKAKSYPGALTIDEDFRKDILSSNIEFTKTDFYLGKQIEQCQWYGIIKHKWDFSRNSYKKMKKDVFESFDLTLYCKITKIIHGNRGSGKTTLLRRLSIDALNKGISPIWITNMSFFYSYGLNEIIHDRTKRYLLIIDGWEQVVSNKTEGFDFLYIVTNSFHVRIVISDVDITNKDYLEFSDDEKNFFLSPSENKDILLKIIDDNPEQLGQKKLASVDEAVFDIPLYIVLFVLFTLPNQSRLYNDNHFPANFFLSQFKSIIRNELSQIYNSDCRGVAKALFYWGNMHKEYGIQLPWELFILIASYYNKDISVKKITDLHPFDKSNPLCKVLSHYIYIEKYVFPLLPNWHTLNCHHDLIINEGFTQPLDKDFYWNDSIKSDLAGLIMANTGPYPMAVVLFLSSIPNSTIN